MNISHMQLLIEKYDLGSLQGECVLLSGGDINTTYRINTNKGSYIVKIIDTVNYAKNYQLNSTELMFSLELSEEIAHLMTDHSIPAITALCSAGRVITSIDNEIFLIYPYIDAKPLTAPECNSAKLQQIAKILSEIHSMNRICLQSEPALKKWSLAIHLVNKIIAQKIWNYLLQADLPLTIHQLVKELDEFIEDINLALQQDIQNRTDLVLTHNDLKPKNVLWTPAGKPFIIDWEAAGYMPIATDYLDTLLGWCLEECPEKLKLNIEKVNLFSAVYTKILPAVKISADSINIAVAKWLVWLAFCVNQMVLQGNVKKYTSFTIEALQILQFLKENYTRLTTLI